MALRAVTMEDGKKASILIKHCPWWIGVLEH